MIVDFKIELPGEISSVHCHMCRIKLLEKTFSSGAKKKYTHPESNCPYSGKTFIALLNVQSNCNRKWKT